MCNRRVHVYVSVSTFRVHVYIFSKCGSLMRDKIYAFTVFSTFIYITTSFCEAALLLFPKFIIDDTEENLRT